MIIITSSVFILFFFLVLLLVCDLIIIRTIFRIQRIIFVQHYAGNVHVKQVTQHQCSFVRKVMINYDKESSGLVNVSCHVVLRHFSFLPDPDWIQLEWSLLVRRLKLIPILVQVQSYWSIVLSRSELSQGKKQSLFYFVVINTSF